MKDIKEALTMFILFILLLILFGYVKLSDFLGIDFFIEVMKVFAGFSLGILFTVQAYSISGKLNKITPRRTVYQNSHEEKVTLKPTQSKKYLKVS